MKRQFLITFLFLVVSISSTLAETANYVFVMFYGSDCSQFLTTIQVEDTFNARLEKRKVKFDWSETPMPRDFLILEGKAITVECDLTEYNETWCVTDATQRIIGISEIFPVGKVMSWFQISEYNGEFTIEATGKDIEIYVYKSLEDDRPVETISLKNGKRFIFNFDGEVAKIGPESIQFIITRKL